MINQIFKPILERLPENNRLERIWVLGKTDFLKRYYGSFLGIVWAFFNPLLKLIVYYLVFTIVFKSQTPNFAMFLFLGLIIFSFFQEATTFSLTIIEKKKYLLESVPIEKLDIYYAASLSSLLAFGFNFSAYFLISLFTPIQLSWSALIFFPLLLLNLLIFTLAVMLIISILQVHLKDFIHLWNLGVFALFWFSGVFFPVDPSLTWKTAGMAFATPLTGIIHNARELLIYGSSINWVYFIYDFAYGGLLLCIGMFIFKRYSSYTLEKT